MSKPVSVSDESHSAIKAYAELHDLTISAAAELICQRGLMGLPAELPTTTPTTDGAAQQEAMFSANLTRF